MQSLPLSEYMANQLAVCPDCGFAYPPDVLREAVEGGGDIVGLLEMWRNDPANATARESLPEGVAVDQESDQGYAVVVEPPADDASLSGLSDIMIANAPIIELYIERYGVDAVGEFFVAAGTGIIAANNATDEAPEESDQPVSSEEE